MHIHNVHAVDIESEVWSAAGCESHNEFIKENITELNNCVSDMIGKEHTKDCLSPVHTSNNVETTFDFVKATFDFPKTATMSNEFIVKFRSFDKVETNWTCSV